MMIQVRNLIILSATVGCIYFLLNLISSVNFISKIALFILAVHLADLFIRFVWNILPSGFLPDVTGKAVFITGCDSGFGNKLARELDAKGVTVFAGCLFAEGSGALKLKKECSKKLHTIQIDVTKDEEVKSAVKYVTDALNESTLHAIVNNAGVFSSCESEFLQMEELKKVLEINTIGVARVTKAFLPLLRKSKGRIVITASLSSTENIPFLGAYSMSKHAVLSYANTLRRELMRWSVSVHTIEPGIYNTEMRNKELIVSKVDNGFNDAPAEVREEYGGEDYLNAYLSGYDIVDFTCSKNIEEVTDCMVDAILGKYPKLRYHPGWVAKLSVWLTYNYPQEVHDLLHHLFVTILLGRAKGSSKKTQRSHSTQEK